MDKRGGGVNIRKVMTPFELREWSFQNNLPDQWWLCLEDVMLDVPVTTTEIKSLIDSGSYSRMRVLHMSQAGIAYPPWVDVTAPKSLKQIPTNDTASAVHSKLDASGESRVHAISKGRKIGRAALVIISFCFLLVIYDCSLDRKVKLEKERLAQEKIDSQVREANLKYNREHPQPQQQATRKVFSTSPKKASANNAWYVGGTLSSGGATMDQWHRAAYNDRLASSADFIARMLRGKLGNLSMDRDIKPMATLLEIHISSAYRTGVTDTMLVTEIAAANIIILKEKGVRGFAQ